jgi:hypothetical protein
MFDLSSHLWIMITAFGGAGLTLPLAITIAIWLALGYSWQRAAAWLGVLAAAIGVVALTKIAFLGWGTPGRRGKSAKWLRRLLFLAVHSSLGFAAVSRHLSRGPPGCRRFHVPWSWLRAYAFANYAAGAGRILHCALRAAADRSPPAATSAAVLLAATEKACRVCGAPTRPNPSREEQIGTPPGSRTCRGCLCNPRFKRIFHTDKWRIRGRLDLTEREWRRLSAALRARVPTWRDGRYGCTLYPYKRTMDFFRKHRHLF